MEYIPYDDFPKIQQKIVKIKIYRPEFTYKIWESKIHDDYNNEFADTLEHFILKTALGHHWSYSSTGGKNPYLCCVVLQTLSDIINDEMEAEFHYVKPEVFIETTTEIKSNKIFNAYIFLRYISWKMVKYILLSKIRL